MKKFKVSVVIPAFNEEANLPVLAGELEKVLSAYDDYEIIFVDDGSADNTLEVIKKLRQANPKINYLSFSRNFGHQYALKAGLDHASGDCVISMDADMQHPPHLLPQLIENWQKGNDIVYTIRQENSTSGWFKRKTSNLFYKLLRLITGLKTPQGAADFRLLDRRVVDALKSAPEKVLFLRGFISWLGFKQIGLPYQPSPRFAGTSHYTLSKMFALAVTGITSFSIQPLRLATYLGLIVAGLGVVFALYTFYARLFTDTTITGWASLMIVVLILGGTQLFIMGIFGEYLGTIFIESKRRPAYIMAETSLPQKTETEADKKAALAPKKLNRKTKNNAAGSVNLTSLLPLSLLAVLTAGLLWALLAHGAWLFGDDYLFMQSFMNGSRSPLVLEAGRFYPLGFAEFNLLKLFPSARSIFAYELITGLVLILTMFTLSRLFSQTAAAAGKKNRFNWQALAFIIFLGLTPAFVQIFLNIVYPEKMVILLLSVFLLFAVRAFNGNRWSDYSLAAAAAVLATYTKEPVFGAITIIAATLLVFGWRQLSQNQRRFAFFLVLNGIVFLGLYYFIAFKDQTSFYNQGKNFAPRLSLLFMMLERNRLFYLFAAVALWRLYQTLRHRQQPVALLFDGFLYASLGWLAAYAVLKLQDNYYLTPAYILGLPALYYYLCLPQTNRWLKLVVWSALIIISAVTKPTPWFLIYHTHKIREQHRTLLNDFTGAKSAGAKIYWYSPYPQQPFTLVRQQQITNIMTAYQLNRAVDAPKFVSELPATAPTGSLLVVSDFIPDSPQYRNPIYQGLGEGKLLARHYIWNLRLYDILP